MSSIFQTPVALITLITEDRVWFKARPAGAAWGEGSGHQEAIQKALKRCLPGRGLRVGPACVPLSPAILVAADEWHQIQAACLLPAPGYRPGSPCR